MPDVVVVGAGGFGRETLDVIEAHNATGRGEPFRVLGVTDDAPSTVNLERLAARGYRYMGTIVETIGACGPAGYFLGVGSPSVKRRLAASFDAASWIAETVVHPSASIGSAAAIGAGTVICGGVQLSTNTRLGRHVHLNPNATIGHDSVLDDFVSVNPGAIISGEVLVERGVLIGAGAVVLQRLIVGANGTVGAQACVTRNTDADLTVVGVPARPLRRMDAQ